MLIWIGIIPPKKIFNEVSRLQKKMGNKYNTYHELKGLLGPHVTLLIKNEIGKKEAEEIENVLKGICNETRSFNLKVDGIKFFRKGKYTCLKVDKSKKINDLYKKISKKMIRIGKTIRFGNFTPHIAIAGNEIEMNDLKKMIIELEKMKIKYKFEVNRLYIARGTPDLRVKISKSFKLNV